MKFTNEQLEKAKNAKTVEELLSFAENEGIELTKEEAEKYFAFLGGADTELPEEALDAVAGGKGKTDPKYHKGNYCINKEDVRFDFLSDGTWDEKTKQNYYTVQVTFPESVGIGIFTGPYGEKQLDELFSGSIVY